MALERPPEEVSSISSFVGQRSYAQVNYALIGNGSGMTASDPLMVLVSSAVVNLVLTNPSSSEASRTSSEGTIGPLVAVQAELTRAGGGSKHTRR